MATMGERIRQLRTERKLAQKTLAGLLNVSFASISKYETDTRKPSLETVNKMADLFQVNVDYLLGRSDFRNQRIFDIAGNLPEEAKEKIEDYIVMVENRYKKED